MTKLLCLQQITLRIESRIEPIAAEMSEKVQPLSMAYLQHFLVSLFHSTLKSHSFSSRLYICGAMKELEIYFLYQMELERDGVTESAVVGIDSSDHYRYLVQIPDSLNL